MNQELLNAAKERFPNLTEAEQRMLLAEKSEPANYLPDNDDSNLANNPECGESPLRFLNLAQLSAV